MCISSCLGPVLPGAGAVHGRRCRRNWLFCLQPSKCHVVGVGLESGYTEGLEQGALWGDFLLLTVLPAIPVLMSGPLYSRQGLGLYGKAAFPWLSLCSALYF